MLYYIIILWVIHRVAALKKTINQKLKLKSKMYIVVIIYRVVVVLRLRKNITIIHDG